MIRFASSIGSVIVVTLMSCTSYAQQATQVLSNKHLGKIQHAENPVRKLKKYKRYFHRDSLKYARNLERYWQSKNDSIATAIAAREKAISRTATRVKDGINSKLHNTVYKPWAKREADRQLSELDKTGCKISPTSRQMLRNYWYNYFLEASHRPEVLADIKEVAPNIQLPKELSRKLADYKTLPSRKLSNNIGEIKRLDAIADLQKASKKYSGSVHAVNKVVSNRESLDSFITQEGDELASGLESRLSNRPELGGMKQQLASAESLRASPGQYKKQMEQMSDSTFLKEQAKKRAEEFASNYIDEHPETFRAVQQKANLLMTKYSIVPNSNDLSTAVKRTSLKGKTFFEHLQVAANFQVIGLDPFSIDFSPQIGYKLNSNFLIGVGGLYRQSFADSIPTVAPDVVGYSAFSTYEVFGSFFVNAEYSRNSPGNLVIEGTSKRIWESSLIAGIGRSFKIHSKLEMTIMAGYNFLHDSDDLVYARPWVVRVGFRSSELAFLNKKRLQGSKI